MFLQVGRSRDGGSLPLLHAVLQPRWYVFVCRDLREKPFLRETPRWWMRIIWPQLLEPTTVRTSTVWKQASTRSCCWSAGDLLSLNASHTEFLLFPLRWFGPELFRLFPAGFSQWCSHTLTKQVETHLFQVHLVNFWFLTVSWFLFFFKFSFFWFRIYGPGDLQH